jgi:hypothetical protein
MFLLVLMMRFEDDILHDGIVVFLLRRCFFKEATNGCWRGVHGLRLSFLDNGRQSNDTGFARWTGHGWVRVGGGDDFINFFYV